jgi:hypothetical protein
MPDAARQARPRQGRVTLWSAMPYRPLGAHADDKKIDALARKWFATLPHPFTGRDRRAGYR